MSSEENLSSEFVQEYNSLLAGEISAVETFDLAIKHCSTANVLETLRSCRDSHAVRVDKLTQRVTSLGGTPTNGSGVWGPFASFVQDAAQTELDSLAMLEESEAERLVNYEASLNILVGEVKHMVESDLIPPQHETHLMLSALVKSLRPLE